MKIAILLAATLSLSACYKSPPAAAVENDGGVQTLEESQSQVPMAETSTSNTMLTEEELDASSNAMMVEKAKDEAEEAKAIAAKEVFELVSNSENGFNVWRDKQTGCEFIEKSDSAYRGGIAIIFIPRPSGGAGQRGCKTGTDFK